MSKCVKYIVFVLLDVGMYLQKGSHSSPYTHILIERKEDNMKKTLSIFIAALILLGCGISVIAFEKGFAAEVADAEICELIDNLAEYHSRQFVENVPTCEIITKPRVAEDLAIRQSCIIDMQKRIGAYFTNASVKIENMKITPIKNGFEVNYDELTVLDYKYPSSAQTDSLEFSITHKVILSRNLEILSDEFPEEMVTGFSNRDTESLCD